MASQIRRAAADTELGRRHPYATLYGGWIVGLVAALVVVVVLVQLWPDHVGLSLPGNPGLHPAWLLLVLVPVGLWLWLAPSRRLNRSIRRLR